MKNARNHKATSEQQIEYRGDNTIPTHPSYYELIRWFMANRCIRQADKLTRVLLTASFARNAFANIGEALWANPSLA
jgi:hypothetical protein